MYFRYLVDNAELIRNVAIAGYLHHGKVCHVRVAVCVCVPHKMCLSLCQYLVCAVSDMCVGLTALLLSLIRYCSPRLLTVWWSRLILSSTSRTTDLQSVTFTLLFLFSFVVFSIDSFDILTHCLQSKRCPTVCIVINVLFLSLVQRGLSIKSTPISLVLPNSRGKLYMVNLFDTPGKHSFCTVHEH